MHNMATTIEQHINSDKIAILQRIISNIERSLEINSKFYLTQDSIKYFNDNKLYLKCLKCSDYLLRPISCSKCLLTHCIDCYILSNKTCPDVECGSNQMLNKISQNLHTRLEKVVFIECANNCGSKNIKMINYFSHLSQCLDDNERSKILMRTYLHFI